MSGGANAPAGERLAMPIPFNGSLCDVEWVPSNAITSDPSGAVSSSGSLFRFAQSETAGTVTALCTLSVSELEKVVASIELVVGDDWYDQATTTDVPLSAVVASSMLERPSREIFSQPAAPALPADTSARPSTSRTANARMRHMTDSLSLSPPNRRAPAPSADPSLRPRDA